MNDKLQEDVAKLSAAAQRIVAGVRAASPGVADIYLYQALAVAAGIILADALYPEMPTVAGSNAAVFLVAGVQFGRERRTEAEKASCHGVA
ncbi:MAG TPA: hypothetical protein VNC39_01560 [Acidocella sp.]|jgi:hypothetical protein|uniref:hypothetical protein n=1 Tax=Acidocella sp. TaxID=50710 RepID=UPI002C10C999|nr:hypothetical protein [Acidocella sp.]HVE20637.1 hypothetical protein [Acidocella sp.]